MTSPNSTAYPGIRDSAQDLVLQEILMSNTTILNGVTDAAATVLQTLGIKTVFDLAGSRLFAAARTAVGANLPDGLQSRFGAVPADWLDANAAKPGLPAAAQQIRALAGMDDATAQALAAACGIQTVADLCGWPPFLAARSLLAESLGTTQPDPLAEDPAADLLRPRLGEYPVERVYYDTLVLFDVRKNGTQPVPLEPALPLAMEPVLNEAGFRQVGVGARVSLCQSWRARGVTLGNLLHSLALAPGEATRTAVLDWSRRTSASTAESVDERESLAASLDRARATKEVQDATAFDAQSGFSHTSTAANAQSGSGQAGIETGLVASLLVSGGASGAYQFANSSSEAQSLSFSQGTRSVMANMEQKVNDRTEQHASSARSRRASIVHEVSESEHATASTRIVANYNHMHALTVQYWEVVQIYELSTQLMQVDRVFFVPVQLPDLSKDEVIRRFRGALTRAALTPRIQELLLNEVASVGVRSVAAPHAPGWKGNYSLVHPELAQGAAMPAAGISAAAAVGAVAPATVTVKPMKAMMWSSAIALSKVLGSPVFRTGTKDNFYPDDTLVVGIRISGLPLRAIRFDRGGAAADSSMSVAADVTSFDLDDPIPLAEIESLEIAKTIDAPAKGDLYLKLQRNTRITESLSVPLDLPQGIQLVKVAGFYTDQLERRTELKDHLQSNAVYYGQAALRSLDAPSVALLLGGYQLDGVSLARLVEPTPIGITGNWLVLRAPAEGGDPSGLRRSDLGVGATDEPVRWNELLQAREVAIGRPGDTRLVPMPTGGVFAEAVLGRSNSAEKLDITRFWNWQDSPIPLAPTDIVPPDLSSRARGDDAKPSQLGAPVLNVMTPPAAPEPAGLSAVLTAVANGAMFRDMSGLAGTQQLAQAGQAATIQSATDAGQIASANMRTQAQKAVAMAQVAADIVKSVLGGGGGSGGGSTISAEGARIAHGQDMDRRGVPAADGRAPGSSGSVGGTPGSGAGGNSAGGASSPASHEAAAAGAAQYGAVGEPTGPIARQALNNMDPADARVATGDAGTTASAGAAPLPPGGFADYVTAHRLNAAVAGILNLMHGYKDDSWAVRSAHFAHAEMHQNSGPNLVGIVAHNAPDELAALKALLPAAEHAQLATTVAGMNASVYAMSQRFNQNGWIRNYVVVNGDKLADRVILAATLGHELSHMRNRALFAELAKKTPTEAAGLFIDAAKAQVVHTANAGTNTVLPVAAATRLMSEFYARLMGYCVKREMQKPVGAVGPDLNVNPLGYFRAAIDIAFIPEYEDKSGYFGGLSPNQQFEQIALWVKQAGVHGIADYTPPWSEKVATFMASVYQKAQTQTGAGGAPLPFAMPTVPSDGMD